jgi:hypothetical protein
MKKFRYKFPSGGTLNHFMKYSFGDEGIDEIYVAL